MAHATQDSNLGEYRRRTAEQARIASLFELLPAHGHTALDVGARDGYLSLQLAQRFDMVVALDLEKPRIDHPRIDAVQGDASRLDYADSSFDAVLCSEVLEHIPDPTRALDEFARLLRPGGRLLLTAPFASFVHMAPYHFCSGFSRYWYEHHLARRGFKIIELQPNGDWFDYVHQEMGRLGSMARSHGARLWPLAYVSGLIAALYFRMRGPTRDASGLACFGWHCQAEKI